MFGNNDQNFNNNFNNNNNYNNNGNNYNGNSIINNNNNNNQNFNNTGYNGISPFENNNQNMGYPGSMSNSWPQQNMMSGFPNQGAMSQPVDIPPVLDPIKPLSSTNNTVAPSMDALNPMNIMPDTLPPSPAEQPMEPSSVGQIEGNVFNYNSELNNAQLNSSELNMPMNNNLNINNSLPGNQINSMALDTQSINDYNQPSVNQSMLESQTQVQNSSQAFENNYNNVSNISSNPVIDNQFSYPLPNDISSTNPQINQANIITSPIENTETVTSNQIDEVANQGVSDFPTMQINDQPSQVAESEEDNADLNNMDDTSSNNVEISDIKLAEDKEKEDINDLGLDSSYTEPDMLEIMDLDSSDEAADILEEVNETKENSLELEENAIENKESVLAEETNIKESVEKIKKLIEEIKYSGIKIELEEFDFEEMYQLVVKINK